jgi:hypothetical protein
VRALLDVVAHSKTAPSSLSTARTAHPSVLIDFALAPARRDVVPSHRAWL